ncbi:MAG: hypothetical protein NVS1B14_04050 [Vulcanimicrobiaceae bacterium]
MKNFVWTMLGCFVLAAAPALAAPSVAASPTPAPRPAFAYDDPAMHFAAPSAYFRAQMPPVNIEGVSHLTPVAAYVRNYGKEDQRTIVVSMRPFIGPPSEWETMAENELRTLINGVFVRSKQETQLSNRMPAYWMKVIYGEGFGSMQQYLYAVTDGRRGITVSVSGRLGEITESEAKDALKDLSVVLYPYGR